jgi:insertion element IS1 protein InsB
MRWCLSVNVVSNGPMSATKTIAIGVAMPLILRENESLPYTFGPRNDETCRRLLSLLSPFQIVVTTSDDWGSYARGVPSEIYLTGKIFTQRIERNNLTLRMRIKRWARKTICFSRAIELREKVIGTFIEKLHFNFLEASPSWPRHQPRR